MISELEQVQQQIQRVTRGVAAFAADLKAQQIHVGLGSPARCVTCETPWPCEHAVGGA